MYIRARVLKERNGDDPRHFRIIPSGADFDDTMCIYIGSVEYGADWVHVYETMGARDAR